MKRTSRAFWIIAPLAIGLLTPSLIIFFLEVFVAHMSPFASAIGILRRQFAEGENLFLIAVIGLIPFVALAVVCFVASRRVFGARLVSIGFGGLLGILSLMIPGHISIWYPLYGGGPASSTAVVGFLFIPIFCLVTLGVGLALGWIVSMLPSFRNSSDASERNA